MSLKNRLAKLEEHSSTSTRTVSIEEQININVACCVDRYGFSQEVVRERLKHEFENIQETTICTDTDRIINMTDSELNSRIAELLDKNYLKYFTDTNNPEIKK